MVVVVRETDGGSKKRAMRATYGTARAGATATQHEMLHWLSKVVMLAKTYCIPEDTMMLINNHISLSQNVEETDMLYASDNQFQSISKRFNRKYNGQLVSIKAVGIPNFSLTPEHPIKISHRTITRKHGEPREYNCHKPIWKEPRLLETIEGYRQTNNDDVKSVDCLVFPKFKIFSDERIIDLSKYRRYSNHVNVLDKLPLTKGVMAILGAFLAEGHATPRGTMVWSFSREEQKFANIIYDELTVIGLSPRMREYRTALTVSCNCKQLGDFLRDEFGTRAWNKKIPLFIMQTNIENAKEFLKFAFRGDGSNFDCKERNTSILSYSTTSPSVVFQLQKLLSKLDVFGKIYISNRQRPNHKIEGRKIKNQHIEYHIELSTKWVERLGYSTVEIQRKYPERIGEDCAFFYLPIQRIKLIPYDGTVFNFMTPDSTYQINNVILHNCPKDTGTLATTIRIVTQAPTGGFFEVVKNPLENTIGVTALITAGGWLVNPRTGFICDYAAAVHDGHLTRGGGYYAGVPFLTMAIDASEAEYQQMVKKIFDAQERAWHGD